MFLKNRTLFNTAGDAGAGGGTAAAPATAASATPATATPPAAATTATVEPTVDPNWLNGRLTRAGAQARADQLKELGFANEEEAKAAGVAAKAAADAKKTSEEREATRIAEVATLSARTTALEATVTARAARELATLTPEQKTAVESLAGTDAAAQLRAIDALSPTWTKPAAATTETTKTVATAAATTAPAAGAAPAQGGTTAPTDHKAVYKELEKSNPVQAANYLSRHQRDIYPAQ